MSNFTAWLLNERGQVTLHQCIRLEVRKKPRKGTVIGRMSGVYPIYQCTETYAERIFGCMLPWASWQDEFPGVPVEHADDPPLKLPDEQAA